MAGAIQFDTPDYAKKLAAAGVPVAQAEAQAKVLGEVLTGSIAFQADLVALENRLATRVATMEARFETQFAELKLELGGKIDKLGATVDSLKWMFGVIAALNIAILVKLIANH